MITMSIYKNLPRSESFEAIMIDPPWAYNDRINDHSRGAINHYPTLTVEQLKQLDINQYCHEDTHLYLWTTKDFRCEAMKLITHWGFVFKTEYIWVKIKKASINKEEYEDNDVRIGMGHWNRLCHEYLLFAIRKSSKRRPLNGKREPSVFFSTVERGHSGKPEKGYELIERNSNPPYLELFARNRREGWTCWGNEV